MFLREVRFADWPENGGYPFDMRAFVGLDRIDTSRFLTFFVGENGSGKSTLLEAIALTAGFNPEGGGMGSTFETFSSESVLHDHVRLSWLPRIRSGHFFRAESFFNVATYLESIKHEPGANFEAYGGRSPHEQSHGESFFNLFRHRLGHHKKSLYLMDEPEAALSPARQLAFLCLLREHERAGASQFIIATHSPILLAYPGAALFNFDASPLCAIEWQETSHYQITRRFLTAPEHMFAELFREDDHVE